jgi:hypothetical protein
MFRTVLASLVLLVPLAAATAQERSITLPHTVNDNTGNQWFLQQQGYINMQGNQPIYGQAGMLQVNGNSLRWRDQQATQVAKTGEVILSEATSQGGVVVQRRVLFDAESGFARVVDVFTNRTGREQTVKVQLQSNVNFGVNVGRTVGDPKGRAGEIGWIGQTPVNRVAVEVLAGRGSKLPPALQWQQGNNVVTAVYDLKLSAGQSAAIAHLHGSVDTLDDGARVFADLREQRLFAYLPPAIRKLIVNFNAAPGLLADLEVLRGDTLDVVELRGGDQLKGTLATASWPLQTLYGPIDLPAARVRAMISVGHFKPRQLVVTDEGEIFGGTLAGESLALTLSSGQVIQVPLSQVTRVGYRKQPGESDDPDDESPGPMLVLRGGDRVLIAPPQQPIDVLTRYGPMQVKPQMLVSLLFQSDEHGVHEVRLRDGSRFQGLVTTPTLAFTLAGGASGQAIELSQPALLALRLVHEDVEPAAGEPIARLVNGDQLVGTLAGELSLDTAFDTLKLQGEQVKAVAPLPDAGDDVQVTLWDGTAVSGHLGTPLVQVSLRSGATVNVPVALLARYDNPQPRPAGAMVEKVQAIVRQLSADDFQARESAEQQLVDLGAVIAPVLRELREQQSPEGQSRIDAVLKKLGVEQPAAADDGPGAVVPPPHLPEHRLIRFHNGQHIVVDRVQVDR